WFIFSPYTYGLLRKGKPQASPMLRQLISQLHFRLVQNVTFPDNVSTPTPSDSRLGRFTGAMYITDLTHFLDEKGAIAPKSGPARKLVEFLGRVVAVASAPTAAEDSLPRSVGATNAK